MKRQMISAMTAVSMLGSFWSGVALAGPESDGQSASVAGNTEFALDLYAQLRTEDGNLILSPHSISTAMAMAYAGGRNETAHQMEDVLHFPSSQERRPAAFEGNAGIVLAG
jgi:serpin B